MELNPTSKQKHHKDQGKTEMVTKSSETNSHEQCFKRIPNPLFPFSDLRSNKKPNSTEVKGTDRSIREMGTPSKGATEQKARPSQRISQQTLLTKPNLLCAFCFNHLCLEAEGGMRSVNRKNERRKDKRRISSLM